MEELTLETQTRLTETRDKERARTRQTQAARQQTGGQTVGDGDGWPRRHTVQYAKGNVERGGVGGGVWVIGEREGGGAGRK